MIHGYALNMVFVGIILVPILSYVIYALAYMILDEHDDPDKIDIFRRSIIILVIASLLFSLISIGIVKMAEYDNKCKIIRINLIREGSITSGDFASYIEECN